MLAPGSRRAMLGFPRKRGGVFFGLCFWGDVRTNFLVPFLSDVLLMRNVASLVCCDPMRCDGLGCPSLFPMRLWAALYTLKSEREFGTSATSLS